MQDNLPSSRHSVWVGQFSKRRVAAKVAKEQKEVDGMLLDHPDGFVTTRWGVEAQLEQPASFSKPSTLLVVADGGSARRATPLIAFGHDFASRHDILAHGAGVVPYPQRTREYGAGNKRISGQNRSQQRIRGSNRPGKRSPNA